MDYEISDEDLEGNIAKHIEETYMCCQLFGKEARVRIEEKE